MSWNPWRALRERDEVILRTRALHPSTGGGRWDQHADGTRTITLHSGLGRVDRNHALQHELVHDERRIAPPDASRLTMELEEARVRAIAVGRTLDQVTLARFVRARVEVEPITAGLVAEELDVPVDVAQAALERLRSAS